MNDIVQDIMEHGNKPISWGDEPGQSVTGAILDMRRKQLEEYEKPGVLEVWSNGDPKLTPIAVLQTQLEEEDGDDGLRDLYLRGGVYTALREALGPFVKEHGADAVQGAQLKVTLVELVKSTKKGGSNRKVFEAELTPATAQD